MKVSRDGPAQRFQPPEAPHLRGRGNYCAFTILEVIVATAIFAVAVVGLAAAYVNILTNIEAVKEDLALENELSLVRTQILLEPELETVEQGGDINTATHGLAQWNAVIEPTETADLFRVVLEITLEGEGEVDERKVEQTLYVLRPDWSDPLERENLRTARREQLEDAKRSRPL